LICCHYSRIHDNICTEKLRSRLLLLAQQINYPKKKRKKEREREETDRQTEKQRLREIKSERYFIKPLPPLLFAIPSLLHDNTSAETI
jgi:hypothetical protein